VLSRQLPPPLTTPNERQSLAVLLKSAASENGLLLPWASYVTLLEASSTSHEVVRCVTKLMRCLVQQVSEWMGAVSGCVAAGLS